MTQFFPIVLNKKNPRRAGFTLIELLVVIAIIAILSVVVVLTLNPADLFRQGRDSTRLSDMDTLTRAVSYYGTDQGGNRNFSLGTPNVTYLSIPDPTATTTAGTNCAGIGFLGGGSFHCAASSTFRNVDGTGWIPLNFTNMSGGSPFSILPVDPTNQSSTNFYYTYQTDGTTFKLRGVPESQRYVAQTGNGQASFTGGSNLALGGGTGWVLVPGNSQFGTSNFWVMKYDASCSDGEGHSLNDVTSTFSNTYDGGAIFCIPSNNRTIASLPGGLPEGNILPSNGSQGVNAVDECRVIGAHLMTNAEWQTVAWNAESQPANWSGGSVGSGYLYVGHSDNLPSVAMSMPDANDVNNCVGTDGPASCGGSGSNASQRRTFTLSDGAIIWDMSGNLAQWVSDWIAGSDEPHGVPSNFWNTEYTAIISWGTLGQAATGPMNNTWNSTKNMGYIYSENSIDPTLYNFLRGGHGGVESLQLNYPIFSIASPVIGFRCVR
jgi:prepilin-type N-terminal cleavage/methylation domain-containing protein